MKVFTACGEGGGRAVGMRVSSTLLLALVSSVGFSQYILVQSHRTIVSRTDSVVGSGEPCPWTSPFASLFTTLQNMPWSHSVHATNNDVIRDYVDYRHDTGWDNGVQRVLAR